MSDPSRPFAVPDYRRFWSARLCSTLAQNSLVVVIGWQVYALARQTMDVKQAALQLGLIGLVQFIPLLLLTLVSGYVADVIDRRRIAQACNGLQWLCATILAILNLRHDLTLGLLFGVATLLGVARAFSMPALGALAPNLVPRALVPRAIAASSVASRFGAILGPAFGGYLYAVRPEAPYLASAGLLTVSILCLAAIGPVPRTPLDRARKPWRLMIEGLHYVGRNRLVLGAISLDLFAVLLGGATAMLPIYAQDILHVGPSGLGHLRAAPAIGATAAGIFFSYRPLTNHVGIKMLGAVALFGAATVVFGLSRSMPLSLVCLVLLGASDMLSVYVRQSLIQISTPDEMRGRVGAVSTLFISASNELGEAESGFFAALTGPVVAVVAGGCGAILVALLWARLFPSLRQAKSFDEIPAQPG
jgi:MFS family permease